MPSRYEESILRSLQKIIQSINQHSHQLSRKHQLTSPQLVCLRQIKRTSDITPSQLADSVSLSRPTITGILERLEARTLVVRTAHPADKRRVTLKLTDEGERLLLAAPSPLQERFANGLGSLHEGEQALIAWVLNRIVKLMDPSDTLGDVPATLLPLIPPPELAQEDVAPQDGHSLAPQQPKPL